MKGLYTLKQRTIVYCVTVLLMFYLLFGTLESIVWAQSVPSCELKISDNGISKEAVVVTYFSEKYAEGQLAYRKVEKLTPEGKILLHEGSINWGDSENSSSNQMSETYSVLVEENADGFYAIEEGVYQVTFYWKDSDDNVIADSEQSDIFTIDMTVPNVTLVCKDEDAMATDVISCGVQVSDANLDVNGVTVVFKKETATGVTIQNITDKEFVNNIEQEFLFEKEGSYTVYVQVKDLAGNTTATEPVTFVIDRTKPIVTIDSGDKLSDGIYNTKLESVILSLKASDYNLVKQDCKVEVTKDGKPFVMECQWTGTSQEQTATFAFGDELGDGLYTVKVSACDSLGLKGEKKFSFIIDNTAPVITQTSAVKDDAYYDGSVCFKYEICEFNYVKASANITVSRTFNGVTDTTTDELTLRERNSSFEYWCKEEGSYTITVLAKDSAGNEATQSTVPSSKGYTVKFVVDKGEPIFSFSGVQNQCKTRNPVEVLVEAKDRNHDFSKYWIEISRRDANQELEHFTISGNTSSDYDVEQGWFTDGYSIEKQSIYTSKRKLLFSKDGIYQITVGGKDYAGNEVEERNITFVIDQTAPSISNVIYSNSKGYLKEKHTTIYSDEAILLEFTVLDAVVGVNDQKVYITVGSKTEKTDKTAMYLAHKSLGNRYYVYIPTDLKVEEFAGAITIWAQDLLQNESSVQSSNMIYTVAKPSIQMNCDVDYSKWTNESVTFQTVVTDEVAGLKQVVYKINGEIVKKVIFNEPTEYYQYDVTASENASNISGYAVTVEATNHCGVTQIAKKQVYIDKEKPVVQLSGVQNGVHYRTSQSFRTDVKDVSYTSTKTVYYVTRTLDGKTMPMSLGVFQSDEYEDCCVRKLLGEGQYRIYAITTDAAGNKQKSNTLSLVIDKTEPSLNITGTSDGAMSGRAVTLQMECVESFYTTNEVKIKVEKELDGKITESKLDGFPNVSKKTTISKTFSEDGTYTVTMTAKDKAGNVAQVEALTFSVDITKPEIYINGTDNYQMWKEPPLLQFVVEESYYSGNKVIIKGTRTDINGNKHTVDLPQMINSGKTSSIQQLFEEDGFYEFFVTAEDKAGNRNSKNIHFTIDCTNPEIKGLTQHQGGYYQIFRLAETLEELFCDLTVVSYRMLLNGIEYNGTDLIETEGKYHLYVEVEDELGNTTIENIEFIIDHTPPKVIFSGIKDGEMVTEGGSVFLALTNAEDRITGIRMNGKEYGTDTRELNYEEYGAYHIEVDCEDLAGNAVTRELYFVYNNPIIVLIIILIAISLIISMFLWLILRTKKTERKYRHDKSSCI